MPVLPTPDYLPPLPFRNADLATLYPPLFRTSPSLPIPGRERIETPDNDFLLIDRHRSRTGISRKLAVISHGLEGHSRKKYVLGMARMATGLGYDAACWCQRSCGGEVNRLVRSYHSGETNDLHTVISHCLSSDRYDEVVLIGFSMGGNQILKYLGEAPDRVPQQVAAAVTFSVPCDLAATERVIARPSRRIYFEYFMRGLREKIRIKAKLFPNEVDATQLNGIHSLLDFDDRYTAPVNGFRDGTDYYKKSSSRQFLPFIRIPTLLVNAQDDPFLAPECFPEHEAQTNSNLFFEMPKYGGHVGFVSNDENNVYWSESRAQAFLGNL
ncbi:alpha/beta fold hydrolase [Pseudodesulfovibrio sp. zrk46]|nr:alpha/beta fold hydrolase [Pseudodesulfovibrio sp. zrk46]